MFRIRLWICRTSTVNAIAMERLVCKQTGKTLEFDDSLPPGRFQWFCLVLLFGQQKLTDSSLTQGSYNLGTGVASA